MSARSWALAFFLAVPAAAGAAEPAAGGESLLDWARSADPLGDRVPRQPAAGDYTSVFGTILDSGCIGGLSSSAKVKGVNTWDADLAQAFALMRSCSQEFPELSGYLRDAVGILRRSVVTCRPTATEGAFQERRGGYSTPVNWPGTPDRQGSTPFRPAGYAHTYYIVIPDDIAHFSTAFLNDYRAGTFFHEPLHYTGANNLADHDSVENVAYHPAHACEQNCFDDRIMFIETVCGVSGDRAFLADRMSRCGIERGCMSALTTVRPDYFSDMAAPHMYGRPFSEREARIFCERLRDKIAASRLAGERGEAAADRISAALNALSGPGAEPAMAPRQSAPKRSPPGRWRLPPHYLAALSPEERARLASAPALESDLQSCRARKDSTIDVDDQPAGCPLSSSHELFPITEKLAGFNNQEALLCNGSKEILLALLKHLSGGATADLDELAARVERLYGEHCPAAMRPGEFYPPICENGRTIIMEALRAGF